MERTLDINVKSPSKIMKIEHIYDRGHDRWIYIETNNCGELGISFMQGDDYQQFVEDFCKVDEKLSRFLEFCERGFPAQYNKDNSEGQRIEFINRVIWTFLELTLFATDGIYRQPY
mgnify:CR=1 FL=1